MSFNYLPAVELSVTTAAVWCSLTVSVWFVLYSVLKFLCAVADLGGGFQGFHGTPLGSALIKSYGSLAFNKTQLFRL